jgi:DUF3047 family protein
MKPLRSVVHELAVASQVWRRARGRRAAGDGTPAVTPDAFRSALSRMVAGAPPSILREHRFLEVPADRPPWLDTGLDLVEGEQLTWFAHGRTYLSRALDIWAGPHFQLWARVGEDGTIFRGVRDTHSFATPRPGRLFLASYFPGEWADATGRLATDPAQYRKVSGNMVVLVLRWAPGVSPAEGLAALAREGDALGLAAGELDRLRAPVVPPEGWQHLWFLGPSEIFSAASDADGRPCIHCETQEDVAILQREARLPLTAATRLRWRWKVDELPAELPEDVLPTHDYMSIAVEFENGQDLTYYWSASLPAGTIYRCPLPTWTARETHWVLRSGAGGLGAWQDEERAVLDDYRAAIGGPAPAAIVRVWLIALSVFQRRRGRSDWADITLGDGGRTVRLCG